MVSEKRMLDYYVYLIVTDFLIIIKKNPFKKDSKCCDQKHLKTTCSSGPSLVLGQYQIFSAWSFKIVQ